MSRDDGDSADPHCADLLRKAMEMESVLAGAGPEALAARPGAEAVARVRKSRSDGKRRSAGINVWFQDETGSGAGADKASRLDSAIAFVGAISVFAALVGIAAATGCSGTPSRQAPEAAGEQVRYADFSGTIPRTWPYCKPFVNDDIEPVPGFLVVQWTKDHPTIEKAGVMVGDICLSWGTPDPEVPETLCDAFLAYLCNNAGDGDTCWFARDCDGKIEVFSCCMGRLHECMAALGTFGLELCPTEFPKETVERIRAAAAARKKANAENLAVR